jgi:hypothetical protein
MMAAAADRWTMSSDPYVLPDVSAETEAVVFILSSLLLFV